MNVTEHLPSKEDFKLIPLRLTEEDITHFRQKGWKYRPTSILTTYKENWTEWFAIREFVQNSLDETGSFDLVYEDELNISYIIDQGEGIDVKDMFLGQQKGATEEEIHCLRGVFGEGMKLALIPLLNNDKQVIIRTIGNDYFFCFIQETSARKGAFEYIGMLTRPNNVTKGTAVAINDVNCLQYTKFFAPTIAKTDPDKVIITVTGGMGEFDHCKVRQAYDIPGMIFVRDIFVQYYDSLFGYNFWFDSTKEALGSDRMELRNYWVVLPELNKIIDASVLAKDTFIPELFRRLALEEFIRIDGESFRVRDSLEWKLLDRMHSNLSVETATVIWSAIFAQVGSDFSWSENIAQQKALEHARIKDLRDILPDISKALIKYGLIRDPKEIMKMAELTDQTILFTENDILTSDIGDSADRQDLTDSFLAVTEQAKFLLKEMASQTGRCRDTKIRYYIGEFEKEERVAGFYTVKTNEIFIRMKNLKDFENFYRVLVHETAHAYCYTTERYSDDEVRCSDLSQGFEDALESVAFAFSKLALRGYCDLEEMERQIRQMSTYDDLLNAIIQQKLQIINNPRGLARPKHENEKDKRLLDETFSRIAKGCYTTSQEIMAILGGYAPNKGYYDVDFWHVRAGRNLDKLIIAQQDQDIIRKLEIEIPVGLQNLTKDKLEDWNTWVKGGCPNCPDRLERVSNFLYEGEDWNDFYTSLEFFKDHQDPRVKRRNFIACSQVENIESLEMLATTALFVMEQGREYYSCLDHNGRWAWAYLNEVIIQFASRVGIEHGWGTVITAGETALHPDNRKYVVYAYRDIAKIHPKRAFDSLLVMLKREDHPEVMSTILSCYADLLGVEKYYFPPLRKTSETEAFKQLILANYDHILSVAAPDDDLNYYREPLRKYLTWVEKS